MMLPEETHNISIKIKNFRLVSLDPDDPGHSGQKQPKSISYDGFPTLSSPVKDTLKSSTEATSQRVLEANSIFGRITSILDHECQASSPESPAAHIKALKNFAKIWHR